MEVILIRHTSVAVPRGTCYGWSDVDVSDTFEEEAARTKEEISGMEFDHVFSSPLQRARKLAAYCGFTHPALDDRLKEMNMGDWEMQRYDEIKDDALQMWYNDYMHLATRNGESFPLLYERVAAFLDELRRKPFRRVAIFAHGGVLICAGIYAGLFPQDEHAFEHLVGFGGTQRIII